MVAAQSAESTRGVAVVDEDSAWMKLRTAVVERDADTGRYIGWVPGFPGAHSQGETLDELHGNLQEVIELLLDGGEVPVESEFVRVSRRRTRYASE